MLECCLHGSDPGRWNHPSQRKQAVAELLRSQAGGDPGRWQSISPGRKNLGKVSQHNNQEKTGEEAGTTTSRLEQWPGLERSRTAQQEQEPIRSSQDQHREGHVIVLTRKREQGSQSTHAKQPWPRTGPAHGAIQQQTSQQCRDYRDQWRQLEVPNPGERCGSRTDQSCHKQRAALSITQPTAADPRQAGHEKQRQQQISLHRQYGCRARQLAGR